MFTTAEGRPDRKDAQYCAWEERRQTRGMEGRDGARVRLSGPLSPKAGNGPVGEVARTDGREARVERARVAEALESAVPSRRVDARSFFCSTKYIIPPSVLRGLRASPSRVLLRISFVLVLTLSPRFYRHWRRERGLLRGGRMTPDICRCSTVKRRYLASRQASQPCIDLPPAFPVLIVCAGLGWEGRINIYQSAV